MTFAIPHFSSRHFFSPDSAAATLLIGVSACLTGAAVRYDGQSKMLTMLQDWEGAEIRLLPVCPEVGAGLSIPRPPVQLVQLGAALHARGRDNAALDVTAILERFAAQSLVQLTLERALCGYIWKSRSPSCGLGSAPVFDEAGTQLGWTSGIQAQRVQQALPWLVHCEETELESARDAARFLLLCRLVRDGRSAWMAGLPLHRWHRHYRFLQNGFADVDRAALAQCTDQGDWVNYLRTLVSICKNSEAERLLGLFMRE